MSRPGRWPAVALVAGLAVALTGAGAPDQVVVSASRSGFRPRRIEVRRGETVRLVVTSADEEHCLAIDALRVEKRVVPGRTVTVEVTPDRAGSFPVQCCLGGEHAREAEAQLVVTE